MISLTEKLHLNRESSSRIAETPLKASIRAKRLAGTLGEQCFVARMGSSAYQYGENTRGFKVGDKLPDGSLVIEIHNP